jgi:(2Fe-2S) ferredoxin
MGNRDLSTIHHHLFICNGESCLRAGGDDVTLAIREQIAARQADAVIHTTRTRCNGRCHDACVVIAYPQGDWYGGMDAQAGRTLVDDLLDDQKHAVAHRFQRIGSSHVTPVK